MNTETVQQIKLEKLVESKTNPRRHFDGDRLKELTRSIAEKGILVPLIARPMNSHFEVVAGARRFRAAKAAKLDSVPVTVRNYTDEQVLEVQVIENLQREDVHPLEEGEGYARLIEASKKAHVKDQSKPVYTVDDIATKVGKSVRYVYQRMQLAQLIEPAKEAFWDGRITAGHADLLARHPSADQARIVKELYEGRGPDREAISVRDLDQWIKRNIMLNLRAAPFNPKDAELVKKAGPCTTCPKRTGNAPGLFEDVGKADVCTDSHCYHGKIQAFMEKKRDEAKEAGEKLVQIYTSWRQGEPESANLVYVRRCVKVGKKCPHVEKGIIIDGDEIGHIVSFCRTEGCTVHHGPVTHASTSRPAKKSKAEREREERQQSELRYQREFRRRLLERIAGAKLSMTPAMLDIIGEQVIEHATNLEKTTLKSIGVEAKYNHDSSSVLKAYRKLPVEKRAGFLLAIACLGDTEVSTWQVRNGHVAKPKLLLTAAKLCGVKVKQVEKEVKKELAPKKKKAKKVQTSAKAKSRGRKSVVRSQKSAKAKGKTKKRTAKRSTSRQTKRRDAQSAKRTKATKKKQQGKGSKA